MTTQELVQETLDSMRDYVPRLVKASEQIAHDVQHQREWLDTMLAYLDGMEWLMAAIDGIRRLDQHALENWNTGSIVPIMDQMRGAMEQQDFVSLCDLLTYEMQPLLHSFDEELRRTVH